MDSRGLGRWRPSVETHSLRYLVLTPVLLAVTTAAVLFVHSDYNLVELYSQCHAYARLPGISRFPVLGPPACYLVSFFQHAVASARASAVMSSILSFVAGLLTVYVVEGARVCNLPNVLIAYPTGPLLVFNLIGGAFIWELLITPAFFHRARAIINARRRGSRGRGEEEGDHVPRLHPDLGEDMRHLKNDAEAIAIPTGVALGFILPSILMLALKTPTAVAFWLFSPVYVTLIRKGVRALVPLARRSHPELRSLHLESHRVSLALVYAAPVACSVLSQGLLLWSFAAGKDDRRDMTRSTLGYVEVNIIFTGLTVLYWLLVEAGWRVVGVMVGVSVVLGPGAGVCAGWVFREGHWHDVFAGQLLGGGGAGRSGDNGDGGSSSRSSSRTLSDERPVPGEDTPLLR